MLHMGKGIAKGIVLPVCVCVGGGLLSGFRHALVGYCLSLTKREGVYEFARVFCCN